MSPSKPWIGKRRLKATHRPRWKCRKQNVSYSPASSRGERREDGRRWKCRAMDAEENRKQVSHSAHSPWKSLCDSHIPTAPTRRGKVENKKHVSHFPACCLGIQKLRKEAWQRIAS